MLLNVTEKKVRDVIDQSPLPLPLGYTDANGRVQRTAEIKDMTGAVDEAISDPKVRNNGGKIVTEAVYGVTTSIGDISKPKKDDIRKMYGADREFLLLASFHNSVAVDEFIKWLEKCPMCKKDYDAQANYLEMPIFFLEGDVSIMELELPRGISADGGKTFHKKLKVSLPTGVVQERVAEAIQRNPGSALTTIIAMCTEEVEGLASYNFETFKDMVKKDRNAIGTFLNEQTIGVDMRVDAQCPHCGHEHKTAVPVTALLGE